MMMTATEERRNLIRLSETSIAPSSHAVSHHDDTSTALVEKPQKYWAGSHFLQAVNACDKLFNCGKSSDCLGLGAGTNDILGTEAHVST